MTSDQHSQAQHILLFKVDQYLFALEIYCLVAVTRILEITPVARTADFFCGLINLRGKLTPVIDLRKLFLFEDKPRDKKTRLITIKSNGHYIAIVVDQVNGFKIVPESSLEEAPEIMFDQFIKSVSKLDDQLILILNETKLINKEEIEAIVMDRKPKIFLPESEKAPLNE